jgi:hypothetical protein
LGHGWQLKENLAAIFLLVDNSSSTMTLNCLAVIKDAISVMSKKKKGKAIPVTGPGGL